MTPGKRVPHPSGSRRTATVKKLEDERAGADRPLPGLDV
jgi:hypothetical protein